MIWNHWCPVGDYCGFKVKGRSTVVKVQFIAAAYWPQAPKRNNGNKCDFQLHI